MDVGAATAPAAGLGVRKLFDRTRAVALGTGVGQAIVLLATPVLARLYRPEDFGALALLTTLGNVAMMVACLRFDVALPSAADDAVRGLVRASVVGSLVAGIVAATGAAWLAGQPWLSREVAALLSRPLLVGACVTLVGLYQVGGAWLLRRGRYGSIAALRVAQGGVFAALAVSRAVGLLWAHALSFAGGLLVAWRAARDGGGRPCTAVASEHRQFPLYGLPGAALDVVGYSTSIWVIVGHYGPGAGGEYSQVQRLIGAPLMLLSISLGQVLMRHTAELLEDRIALRRLVVRTLAILAGLSAAALGVLAVAGVPVLRWVLGPGWRVERELVVLVALAVFVRACVSPASVVLLTLRRFRLTLAWQGAYFASAMLLMPWVAGRVSFDGYLRFYAAHELGFYGAYSALILYAVRKS